MSSGDLGEIIRRFSPKMKGKLTHHHSKVLGNLAACRTEMLGGSVLGCKGCGRVHYVRHSCRNRHCPCCQGIDRELWVASRKEELLPVKYFHVVFTVPHDLLELFRFNKEMMYNLLFEQSWKTLQRFGSDPKWLGAQLGAMAILHTWDQQMKLHPHVHFIVPAGGLTKNREWKSTKSNGDYLFDVRMLSEKFRGSFVAKLRKLKRNGKIIKAVPRTLYDQNWVVYAKQAFGSPENVVEYLGRYTHRVAISNARIKSVTDKTVRFSWSDRKKNYQQRTTELAGTNFLERFIQHILPPGFTRIRHYGFMSPRCKEAALSIIRRQLGVLMEPSENKSRKELAEELWGKQSVFLCPECGGEFELIESFQRKRAPPAAATDHCNKAA